MEIKVVESQTRPQLGTNVARTSMHGCKYHVKKRKALPLKQNKSYLFGRTRSSS